jgi:hypothetical protein
MTTYSLSHECPGTGRLILNHQLNTLLMEQLLNDLTRLINQDTLTYWRLVIDARQRQTPVNPMNYPLYARFMFQHPHLHMAVLSGSATFMRGIQLANRIARATERVYMGQGEQAAWTWLGAPLSRPHPVPSGQPVGQPLGRVREPVGAR